MKRKASKEAIVNPKKLKTTQRNTQKAEIVNSKKRKANKDPETKKVISTKKCKTESLVRRSTKSKPSIALLTDLTHLQSLLCSLLTSLLLHRAYNNNSIHPPVFAAIKHYVERLCRRNITLEDVRKIVYLSHFSTDKDRMEEHWENEGGLKLVNYGNNKICIVFAEKTKARKLVNSDNLKNDFTARVTMFWKSTNTNAPLASLSVPLKSDDDDKEEEEEEKEKAEAIPMSIIPLAKLHARPKGATIAKVLQTKSQQRLDDLLRRHKQPAISFPSVKNPTSTAPLAKRGSSLLHRIRVKAALAVEAASTTPSKEELERTAAKQRVPDIEPILKGLAARGSNITMKACVEGIRESVKNPVSSEQAEMVVRLIAEREGEGWVTVREVGKVVGVVFEKREGAGRFL